MAEQTQISEERLIAIKEEAARNGRVQGGGVVPGASPFPKLPSSTSYHGNPVLKAPTWTWQVPLYFFAGGVAGTAAVVALVAHVTGNAGMLRAALWIAFAGALASPPLLIADLGRPARFLNMMRVFKLRSAMSVGAWTLAGFSAAIGLAVVCHEVLLAGYGIGLLVPVEWLAEIFAAISGLILASYTSVLLGMTAIPVWSENRRLIPAVFLAGGLGSAAAVLELLGFLVPATQFIGIVASVVEMAVAITVELRGRYVDRPLHEGRVGWLMRAADVLVGPVSLLIRIFWGYSDAARQIAAVCFITGALITRYAWMAAGRVSSLDPQALFQIQQGHAKRA